MSDYGPEAKQDYAVQVEGLVVLDILQFELEKPCPTAKARPPLGGDVLATSRRLTSDPGEAQALFVWRDNRDHRDDIERHYLKMLTSARREVIIANAYFFPATAPAACDAQCRADVEYGLS